jgi:type III secretory pathway lipoprotein EscJ
MTQMVQLAVAGDVTEGEEIQALLVAAGINSELQADAEDDGFTVLVPESSLEAARDAIEVLGEPDEDELETI